MSISSTASRVSYAGNGVTTAFSFPYKFDANADLVVILRVNATGVETTQTITTHYTVSGAGSESGGTVTMLTAPTAAQTLVIYRDPAQTQVVDLVENDPLPAETLEDALDKLTMIAQRLKDRTERSIALTDGFSPSFSLTLPSDLDQGANKVLLVNSTATGFAATSAWPTANDITNAQANATAAAASASAAATSASSASSSATSAASSAANAAAQLASAFFRDIVYLTFADSPFTVTSSHNGKLLMFDSSGGAISVTLPQISLVTLPFNVAALIKTGGNNVTFNRSGTDTIMGATSKVLATANTGAQFVADIDASPDDWGSLDFGSVGDGTVTKPKLATGAKFLNVTSKTANYTATSTDEFIACSTSSGAFTITLPAAASNSGMVLHIKKTNSEFNPLTVDGNGSETIDGALSKKLYAKSDFIEIVSDGSNWHTVSEERTISAMYRSSSGQTVTTDGTIIDFATSSHDTGTFVTTGASWKFTVATGDGGEYLLTNSLRYNTNPKRTDLYKNGALDRILDEDSAASTVNNSATKIRLADTDYIDLRVQGSATATLQADANFNWITIKRVGN